MPVSFTPIKLIPSTPNRDDPGHIYMSRCLIDHLKMNNNQKMQICLGGKTITVIVLSADINQDECHLPETVMADLSLPIMPNKFLCTRANQTLYLGPVVALLTEIPADGTPDPHFGTIHHFCQELNMQISKVGGFFYVFSVSGFSCEGINGYYFDGKKWKKAGMPFPDCIYNRIHSRRIEQSQIFQNLRNALHQLKVPLFNDRYLSKWDVYQLLLKNDQILSYIPETQIFTRKKLLGLLEKYHTIFIKPEHGSQGRNILKIAKETGQYSLQGSQNPKTAATFKVESIEVVLEHLASRLQHRVYLIQQGIPLLEYQTRSMDFRVLVHRKEKNLWQVTSIIARLSAEDQFVSNLAKGGTIMNPSAALLAHFNKQTVLKILTLMKELSLETAAVISEHSSGIFGELGIDIGIDQQGKPWIIEVNSKPSKNFEDHCKVRPSAKAIIRCCGLLFADRTLEKGG